MEHYVKCWIMVFFLKSSEQALKSIILVILIIIYNLVDKFWGGQVPSNLALVLKANNK